MPPNTGKRTFSGPALSFGNILNRQKSATPMAKFPKRGTGNVAATNSETNKQLQGSGFLEKGKGQNGRELYLSRDPYRPVEKCRMHL
jgi:hypothetical protein